MYENSIKTNLIIFCICTLCYLLSPKTSLPVFAEQSKASKIESTGGTSEKGMEMKMDAPIPDSGKANPEKQQPGEMECNADCKIKTLIDIGIREEIAESLVINCKALATDPRKCVIIGASIVKNESGGGFKCRKANRFNCFGIMVGDEYKSYNDSTLHFVGKFQKWWHKAESMSFFYPPAGGISRSRYCTSEDSSGSSVGCPNGLRNSQAVFNKLNKLF